MTREQPAMSNLAVFRLLIPLHLGVVIGPLNTAGTFNLIPVFSEDFGVSLHLAGLSVSLYMFPFIASQVGSGAVSEGFGPARTLILGMLTFSIACVIAAFAQSYSVFLAARAIQGLAVGLILPVSMAMTAEQVPFNRAATGIGLIQAVFAIGLALGPGVAGLFTEHLHWRGFYFFLAAGGATSAGVIAAAYGGGSHGQGWRNPLRPLQQALTVSSVIVVCLAGFFSFFAYAGIFIFTLIWLQNAGLMGPTGSGLLLSIPGIVGIVLASPAGYIGDRWGVRPTLIAGIALLAVGNVGLMVMPSLLSVYPLSLVLIGTGATFVTTILGTIAVSIRPDLRGAIAGLFNGSRFLGLMLAPLVLAPVYEMSSIRGTLLTAGVAWLFVTIALGHDTERDDD